MSPLFKACEPQTRPMFPHTIDSTILSAFRSCPQKAFLQYVQHWKPIFNSVHLVAGGAFASGIEAARRAFYVDGASPEDAEAAGMQALIHHYGDFECPADSAKSLERMIGALEFYFFMYPLGNDGANPITLPNGTRGIEFSFAEPIDINHPVTGEPILYTGRSDMIAERAGGIYIYDEKTTSSLGASWGRQWEMRCFSPDHELYTRSGWKRIDQLSEGEEVMQSDAEGLLSFVIPSAYHSYESNGELVSIEGRRLSQLVTKNHRMLLNKRRGGQAVVLAEDLRLFDEQATIPLAGRHYDERLPDILQRFLVAVQADGCLRTSEGKVTGGQGHREHMPNRAIDFKFVKPRKIQRLKEILDELRCEYTHNPDAGTFRISGHSLLAETVDTFLDENKEFRDGHEYMYGTAFLQELRHWDGWEKQYYTKSKKNAEFVVTVAALNDMAASCTHNLKNSYTVVLSTDVTRSLKTVSITDQPYSGNVYCVTVPSGFLLVRRNGSISISGNSQFTGYAWAAHRQGIKTAGTIVRGVSILKTKYDTLEVPTYRSQYEIDRWEEQLHRDVQRMIRMWEEGYWDYSLDGGCNEYGGCSFTKVCKASNPEDWLPVYFEQRVWDPLLKKECTVKEYEESWGHVRAVPIDNVPLKTGEVLTETEGVELGQELKSMLQSSHT